MCVCVCVCIGGCGVLTGVVGGSTLRKTVFCVYALFGSEILFVSSLSPFLLKWLLMFVSTSINHSRVGSQLVLRGS